jgi:hypothetical protein
MDLLPAGIVHRASAFTECCRANAAPMPGVAPVIGAIAWRRAYGRHAYSTGPPHDQCGKVRSSGTNSGRS